MRVDFRPNRGKPSRESDWTRRYEGRVDEALDAESSRSVRAKGEISRKRTIIVDETDLPAVREAEWFEGTVTAVHGRLCRVDDALKQEWQCTIRRVLRTLAIDQRFPVACGDRVRFSASPESTDTTRVGVIERVEPRRSVLSRRESRENRGREHIVVANADQLLILSAVAKPRYKAHLIDRYLVAASKGGLSPIVCFTKCDLAGAEVANEDDCQAGEGSITPAGDGAAGEDERDAQTDLESLIEEYRALGYRCLVTSAVRGDGLEELSSLLRGHITVFSGQSGVGKSSLINAIEPTLNLAVMEVSGANEKGRHATTIARLMRLGSGGYVVDTPGIRQFDMWSVTSAELEAYFPEFQPLLSRCRFKDCLHGDEVGCAVRAAAEEGRISWRRYLSYVKMLSEL